MTITEFLLARIADDEAMAEDGVRYEVAIHYAGGGDWESLKDRWLAECEAKRRIVGLHTENCVHECTTCLLEGDWPCQTLRALAAVYADHPDYQREWEQ